MLKLNLPNTETPTVSRKPTQARWRKGRFYSLIPRLGQSQLVERAGFEPAYSKRADLQSAAINHSATSPLEGTVNYALFLLSSSTGYGERERVMRDRTGQQLLAKTKVYRGTTEFFGKIDKA